MNRLIVFGLSTFLSTSVAVAWQMPTLVSPTRTAVAPELLPALPGVENVQGFDPQDLRVVWGNRRWQIVSRGQIIKEFGSREQDARQAVRILQELGINQHGLVGTNPVVMEYWLTNGKVPQGLLPSHLRTTTLELPQLRVEQKNGQWYLRDNKRVLMHLGPRASDAQQALGIIRKYQFEQVGVIGQAAPSMYVFLGRTNMMTPSLSLPAGAAGQGRQIQTTRFSRLAKNSDGTPRFEKTRTSPAVSSMAGLDQAVTPVIAPLVDQANQRRPDQARPFQWHARSHFAGQPSQVTNDRIGFDWRQVQLRQDESDWKLTAGRTVLANFGPAMNEARLALQAMRYYRFTEQWRVGGQNAYLTYYVAPGTAPRGLMFGLQGEEFKPTQLKVKKVETGYALCQGQRVVLRLREREEDARKVLDSITRANCDQLCKIGKPGQESMTLLVRSR
jgi:hypothetical protein